MFRNINARLHYATETTNKLNTAVVLMENVSHFGLATNFRIPGGSHYELAVDMVVGWH